jgi:hypothetical protein
VHHHLLLPLGLRELRGRHAVIVRRRETCALPESVYTLELRRSTVRKLRGEGAGTKGVSPTLVCKAELTHAT